MKILDKIFSLTIGGFASSLFAGVVLYFYFKPLTFVIIPAAFLQLSAALLLRKGKYREAYRIALIGGIPTFPVGGFLSVWAGTTGLRYYKIQVVEKELEKRAVNPKLVKWIKERLEKGYMEDYVYDILKRYGYNEEKIEKAMKRVSEGE